MSLKRFNGWEPQTRTTVERGRFGQIVGWSTTQVEPEWDDTERAWMLGLAEWRASLCPLCGWPRSICQDPGTEMTVRVPPPTRCHVATAIDQARTAHTKHPLAAPHGLLWTAEIKS